MVVVVVLVMLVLRLVGKRKGGQGFAAGNVALAFDPGLMRVQRLLH